MTKYQILHTPFYYLTIVSLVILLFFGALLFSSALLTLQLPKIFSENIQLLAELGPGSESSDVDQLSAYLSSHAFVIANSVEIVTRDEALKMMEEAMGAEILLADMTNPFMDVVRFRVKGEHMNQRDIEDIRKAVTGQFPVKDVYVPGEAMGASGVLVRQLSGILVVAFLVLLTLVFVLIHQIMRMNILSNRYMIRTMEIVGASRKFIMRPFVREAIKLGAISACLACGLYLFLLFSLIRKYGEFQFGSLVTHVIYVVIFTGLLSFIVSLMSTAVAVQRQLGRGYDEA